MVIFSKNWGWHSPFGPRLATPMLWCSPFWHTKNWAIGFVVSITARSASALAVAFFRLLEPLSYYASTFSS